MKYEQLIRKAYHFSRSLYWERGLKSSGTAFYIVPCTSLPLLGAWIEIIGKSCHTDLVGSLPLLGAWIEIAKALELVRQFLSLPLLGAWIEIIAPAPGI